MKPEKFCSYHCHKKLYDAYDQHPEIWKPQLFGFFINRWFDFNDETDFEKCDEYHYKTALRIQEIKVPWEMETCDYWCEKRISNAVKFTKHAACQFMSRANYHLAQLVMPKQNWFHIADDEFNDGGTHHYVVNERGQVLDPQGIALDFQIPDYQEHFTQEMVSDRSFILSELDAWSKEYQYFLL